MAKSMKITKVTPLMLDRYLCVTVDTDAKGERSHKGASSLSGPRAL